MTMKSSVENHSREIGILVLDYAPEPCQSASDMLSGPGWQVTTTSGTEDCLSKIQVESFDVVVVDLGDRETPRLDLLQDIRKKAPATLILAITAEPTASTLNQTMRAGAFDCLAKPVSTQELRRAVEWALRARSRVVLDAGQSPESGWAEAGGYAIRVKPELCWACLSCAVACAYANLGLPEDAPLRSEFLSATRLSVETAGKYAVPLLCMQCGDAPCMSVCPSNALQRTSAGSPVFSDIARCIRCGRCVLACPLGALTLDAHNQAVQKCDLCLFRTKAGHLPACVESCPMEALELVRLGVEIAGEAAIYFTKTSFKIGEYKPLTRPLIPPRAENVGTDQAARVETVIRQYGDVGVGFLIPILQDIQREYGYLPLLVLKELSQRLSVPLSRIYNVATFYKSLSLKPRGRHIISVCTGTVCHLKGAGKLTEAISDQLEIPLGGTTRDLRFSLENVNCLGACALAPVLVVDGHYYAKVEPAAVKKILQAFS
jgi:NADH:ubiquinone oxidoreductase subunit E/Fe-S-cluster-containing dehydrogenase component/CheY-like chemotaxis protein